MKKVATMGGLDITKSISLITVFEKEPLENFKKQEYLMTKSSQSLDIKPSKASKPMWTLI